MVKTKKRKDNIFPSSGNGRLYELSQHWHLQAKSFLIDPRMRDKACSTTRLTELLCPSLSDWNPTRAFLMPVKTAGLLTAMVLQVQGKRLPSSASFFFSFSGRRWQDVFIFGGKLFRCGKAFFYALNDCHKYARCPSWLCGGISCLLPMFHTWQRLWHR